MSPSSFGTRGVSSLTPCTGAAAAERAFGDIMDRVSSAFALTHGREHALAYANAAFCGLLGENAPPALERPIARVLELGADASLLALLDRAFRTGIPVRAVRVNAQGVLGSSMACSVWPTLTGNGDSESLLIEMRPSTQDEITIGLQREVVERLLESALREQRTAEEAEAARRSASFLATESRRLGESLDEEATIGAIRRTALPHIGSWCVVDILAPDHTMHRLTVVHPDQDKQGVLTTLEGQWTPELGDVFGLPAAIRAPETLPLAVDLVEALANTAHPPEVIAALHKLGAGPSLVVPLKVGDRLMGAITFIAGDANHAFSPQDVDLANELADRSAAALDRARRYGESLALRMRAESANLAKSTFLGMMSHELRTPLNAIAGYVDIIAMGLRGPVTDEQQKDLDRIRTNQKYLTGLLNDLLSLTKVNGGQIVYNTTDFDAREVIEASRVLVAPLFAQRHLEFEDTPIETAMIARGDRDKVVQILVNLLGNSIKFTAPGGRIRVFSRMRQHEVDFCVCDTGIGIPPEKLEVIFDPFVQLDGGAHTAESGVGLGLAISRGLARAMHGDLVASNNPGGGAVMTLTLPTASAAAERSV